MQGKKQKLYAKLNRVSVVLFSPLFSQQDNPWPIQFKNSITRAPDEHGLHALFSYVIATF